MDSILKLGKKLLDDGVFYDLYIDLAKPKLEEWVKDSETKIDDYCMDAINLLVDKFLKPDAKS